MMKITRKDFGRSHHHTPKGHETRPTAPFRRSAYTTDNPAAEAISERAYTHHVRFRGEEKVGKQGTRRLGAG